jgi:hypothetical protein
MQSQGKPMGFGVCKDSVRQGDARAKRPQDFARAVLLVFYYRRNGYRHPCLGEYRLGGFFLCLAPIYHYRSRQLPLWVRQTS